MASQPSNIAIRSLTQQQASVRLEAAGFLGVVFYVPSILVLFRFSMLHVSDIALAANFVWSFRTSAPTVISTVPASGATAVPVNTLVSAAFSEAIFARGNSKI